jgi:hypothetical protein
METLLISVLTPSGIISGIALTVLWGYFSRLDRLDVFFEVMSIKSLFALVWLRSRILISDSVIYLFYNLYIHADYHSSRHQ